jgi:cell division protein FtsL
MRRWLPIALAAAIPLALLAVAWQAARYDALAAEARRLEAAQASWVDENRKLAAGIRVLSSKERVAKAAEELGLERAGPERRLRVLVMPPAPAAPSAPGAVGGLK